MTAQKWECHLADKMNQKTRTNHTLKYKLEHV